MTLYSIDPIPAVPYEELHQAVAKILTNVGFYPEHASAMATTFLEADLMGYSTHGLQLLSANIGWLEKGETNIGAEIEVLNDLPACFLWDAHFLPGPYVMHRALDEMVARVRQQGIVTAVIKRSQHIACQAAYMPRLIEAGLGGFITCVTASEHKVSPQGGTTGVLSTNPFAMGAPGKGDPIIIDVSTSITAGGYVKRALLEERRMERPTLKDKHGHASDDPLVMMDGGSMQPMGGLDHGYKGFAFSLMSEILTTGLSGYGRADAEGDADGEANTVYIQLFDPERLGGLGPFKRQIEGLQRLVEESGAVDATNPPRVPGMRAWGLRQQQLREGVTLYPLAHAAFEELKARYL